jgi:hypothetical protein
LRGELVLHGREQSGIDDRLVIAAERLANPRRNAESLSHTQLSVVLSIRSHPHDFTKILNFGAVCYEIANTNILG